MSPLAGMTSGIRDATGDNSLIITAASVKLNGVNVGESRLRVWKKEALDCTLAIVNNSEVERAAVIVIAVYSEENYLCGFETVSITLEGGESENAQIIYNFPGNAHRGKIMFWDSLSGMVPLRTEISFSETNGVNAYHYTTDNRLQKVDKANGSSLVYNYDKMGNLTSKTVTGGAENE